MTLATRRSRRYPQEGLAPGLVPAFACLLVVAGTWGAAAQDLYVDESIYRRLDALEAERQQLRDEIARLTGLVETTVYAARIADGGEARDERHFGPATFVVAGNRLGDASSLELDHDVLRGRCADAEGCLVSMALEGATIAGEEVSAAFPSEPCTLDLDEEEGEWAVSSTCALLVAGGLRPAGDDRAWGEDGDDKPMGEGIQAGRVLLSFADACFLAESRPDRRGGTPGFERDTNRNLFLVAAGPAWDPSGNFPADILPTGPGTPDFRCRLSVRD